MTTVRAPAPSLCVTVPVSRSPDGRVGPVERAATSRAASLGAALMRAADVLAELGMDTPGLMLTLGKEQPARPAASVLAIVTAPTRAATHLRDIAVPPVAGPVWAGCIRGTESPLSRSPCGHH